MIIVRQLLIILFLVCPARAGDKPGLVDYAAVIATADIVFDGTVESVVHAEDWKQLTKVCFRVHEVFKGNIQKNSEIEILHEPGRIVGSPVRRYSYDLYPDLRIGKSYSIWAVWNSGRQCYILTTRSRALEK